MSKNLIEIPHLEDEDFDNSGKLKIQGLVIVMIQGDFCGYCTQMKPAFQAFADKNKGKLTAATIKTDGNKSEKALAGKMSKSIEGYRGVPTIIGYKNGLFSGMHTGGRDIDSLQQFSDTL
jgi:thiol-disulfide isomerase/thioredoxin